MFSKNIVNYAIILDAEDSVIFAKEEPILVGKHNINEYKENYELVKCRKYYDKHFRNLVSNAVITQKAALDLTKILYIYFDTMSGLGQVIKKSIRFYWESTNMEQDELDMLLEKAGWK